MAYIYCKKHKIKYNDEEAPKCPICVYRKIVREITPEDVPLRTRWRVPSRSARSRQARSQFGVITPAVDEIGRNIKLLKGKDMSVIMKKKNAIVLLRDVHKLSFPAIGRLLGYKDHTTAVHHYYRK